MEWGNLFKSYELFGQTRFVTVLLEIVGGAAEKYARARSGDTTFFIYYEGITYLLHIPYFIRKVSYYLQTEHKKQGEET